MGEPPSIKKKSESRSSINKIKSNNKWSGMSLSKTKTSKERLIALKGDMIHRLSLIDKDKRGITNPIPKSLDDQAVVNENREVVEKLSQRDKSELQSINVALQKIMTGTYGICSCCGNKIEIKRLKAVPYAANCIECEENQ